MSQKAPHDSLLQGTKRIVAPVAAQRGQQVRVGVHVRSISRGLYRVDAQIYATVAAKRAKRDRRCDACGTGCRWSQKYRKNPSSLAIKSSSLQHGTRLTRNISPSLKCKFFP